MGKHTQELRDLQVKFCNQIEDNLHNINTIEFNEPFVVYVIEENSYDDSVVKASHICKTLVNGKFLGGEAMGSEFDDLPIYNLEDIMEVAYILDQVTSKNYKVIENAE